MPSARSEPTMSSPVFFKRFALPVLATSLVLGAGGCANQKTTPPIEAPLLTSAKVTPRLPRSAPGVVSSPNVNVSDELAAACRLEFNDIDSAPRFDFDQSTLGSQDS